MSHFWNFSTLFKIFIEIWILENGTWAYYTQKCCRVNVGKLPKLIYKAQHKVNFLMFMKSKQSLKDQTFNLIHCAPFEIWPPPPLNVKKLYFSLRALMSTSTIYSFLYLEVQLFVILQIFLYIIDIPRYKFLSHLA